jgi:diguanylate cyclase (GGDEF)-like protein/putative nucleotidyltransferase with HDIG domain
MVAKLLGFRNYLVLLALAVYLLATHQLGEGMPGWAPALLLFAASLSLARTRLRVKRVRGVLATSEAALFGCFVVLSPLLAGAVALLGNALRLLLEGPAQIRRSEMALRAGVSGVSAVLATLVYAEFAGGAASLPALGNGSSGPDPLGLCGAAGFYLFSTALMDAFEDRLPHWRKLLPAAALGSATMAVLFAPLAAFVNLAFYAGPLAPLWTIAPFFVALYAAVEWWLGPLYDDQRSRHEADQVYLPVVEALALAVEAKDSVSSAHLKRVQRYSVEIAKALNCTEEEIRALEFGALLHDIGKIAIPEVLLTKPGRLSPQEFSQMAIHPQVGAEILSAVDFPFPVAELVLCHHENWDGSGYPRRLKGDQIPLTARILSVVDCFDALTSDRPYRPAMSVDRAIDIIKTRRGKAFEPKVTDTLLEILPRMEEHFRRERERETAKRRGFNMPRAVDTEQTSLTYEERIASLKQTRPAARQRSRADDLTSWYRLLATLGSTLPPHCILDFVLPMLKERMPLEEMAVFLAGRNGLRPIYCTGPKADLLRNLQVPIGDSPTGWVAGHGETLLNGNPMRECGDLGTMAWLLGLNSALVTPLWEGGRAVGTINLYSKESAIYSHEHAAMLERLTPNLGGVVLRAAAYPVRDHSGVDALTGLPNAAQLLTYLATVVQGARAEQRTVSVIYIDIDNFSVVNARLGHGSGDRLLLTFSRVLHDCFENGELLARLGEDQFVGVLPGISPERLNSFIKKLKMTVREETHGSFEIPISISVGTATFPNEVNSPEALLVLSNQRSFLEKLSRGAIEPQFAPVPVPIGTRAS